MAFRKNFKDQNFRNFVLYCRVDPADFSIHSTMTSAMNRKISLNKPCISQVCVERLKKCFSRKITHSLKIFMYDLSFSVSFKKATDDDLVIEGEEMMPNFEFFFLPIFFGRFWRFNCLTSVVIWRFVSAWQPKMANFSYANRKAFEIGTMPLR